MPEQNIKIRTEMRKDVLKNLFQGCKHLLPESDVLVIENFFLDETHTWNTGKTVHSGQKLCKAIKNLIDKFGDNCKEPKTCIQSQLNNIIEQLDNSCQDKINHKEN